MKKGVIYILTNPSFPDYVKIGYAKDLEKRMNQLNRSEAIPYAFRAYAIYEVNSNLTDLVLHEMIDKLNPDLRSIETFDGKKRYECQESVIYHGPFCGHCILRLYEANRRISPQIKE